MCILHLDALVCQRGYPMAQQSPVDKFFDAVDNAYDVVLDTLKAGVDRGYRVSKGLIEQAQTGQHATERSRGLFARAQERARQVIRPGRGGNGARAEGEPRPRRKAQAEE